MIHTLLLLLFPQLLGVNLLLWLLDLGGRVFLSGLGLLGGSLLGLASGGLLLLRRRLGGSQLQLGAGLGSLGGLYMKSVSKLVGNVEVLPRGTLTFSASPSASFLRFLEALAFLESSASSISTSVSGPLLLRLDLVAAAFLASLAASFAASFSALAAAFAASAASSSSISC